MAPSTTRSRRTTLTTPPLLTKMIAAYERVQVELHGKYSVERVAELHAYERTHATWQCVLVLLATPLPCLSLVVLTDLVSLNAPTAGRADNAVFWARVFFVALAIAVTLLDQARRFVAGLPLSTRMLWGFSLVLATCTTAWAYMVASLVGFPIPFTIIMSAPCFSSTFGVVGYLLWGTLLRESAVMRHDVVAYIKIMVVQFSLTVVYPGYNYLFIQLTGFEQTLVALLLPIIKLVAKNAISSVFSRRLEDFKPEVVIFNVEVFHALFVSCCMQSSTSWTTTIALMGVDFVHAWSSLRDVETQLRTIEKMEAKLRITQAQADAARGPEDAARRAARALNEKPLSLIEKAMYYVQLDAAVRDDASIRLRSVEVLKAPPASIAVHPIAAASTAGVRIEQATSSTLKPAAAKAEDDDDDDHHGIDKTTTSTATTDVIFRSTEAKYYALAGLLSNVPEDKRSSLGVLSTRERIAYVSSILQVLHIAEFLLLIELVEVVIPVIYCVYLTAMFYLPNRVYYPQLAQMDSHSLLSTIGSTLAYAALEFVSFIGLSVALKRKLQLSPVRQLAFVIHTQWHLVQAKMILWVVFAVQISLEHFGYDYSFQFAWLRTA